MKSNQIIRVQYYLYAAISLCSLSNRQIIASEKCSKQSDCPVSTEGDPCAICVDDGRGTQGHCVHIHPDVYKPNTKCVKYTDKTCPLKCPNGTCLTSVGGARFDIYYVPYCRCDRIGTQIYYGDKCQYLSNDGTLQFSYVKYEFINMVAVGESTNLVFTFHSWSEDMEYEPYSVVVTIGDVSNYIPHHMVKKELMVDNQFVAYLRLKHVFPYKDDRSVYRLRDQYIGYETDVSMYVYSRMKIAFQHTWGLFVKYEGLKCFPKIRLTNCAAEMAAPPEFKRSAGIVIHIDVRYVADGSRVTTTSYVDNPMCEVKEKMIRKIFKVTDRVTDDQALYEKYEPSQSIYLEPFQLEFGIFQVHVEVTNTRPEKLVTNTAHCYFKITCFPLVAKIEGGNSRLVSANHGLLLIADKSHDPNTPPNDQDHVFIEWSCVNVATPNKPEELCEPKGFHVSDQYYIPQDLLVPGEKYNFTLKVWTNKYNGHPDCSKIMSPQTEKLTVKVAERNETEFGNVVIECVVNCELRVTPNKILYLKARQPLTRNDTSNTTYVWTYQENDESQVKPTDDIKVSGTKTYILIINENVLKLATRYTILVIIENTTWYAKYDFETVEMDFDVSCSVVPENGTKGRTMFEITCAVLKNPCGCLLTYEFYDKNDTEKDDGFIFSGRMLGTSKSGRLPDVRLTRGNIMIYIIVEYGLYVSKDLTVTLEEWEIGDDTLGELYQDVADRARFGSIPSTLEALSFIPDIIPGKMDQRKGDIFNTLIGFMTQLSLTNLDDMKMSSSTLINVLFSLNKPKQLQLKPYYIAATFQNIKKLADIFSQKVLSGEVRNMSPKEVKQMSIGILNCLQAGLLCKDKRTVNIQEREFDFSDERELRRASLHAERIIERVADTLSYTQAPGQPVTRVSSNDNKFVLWIMVNGERTSIVELLSKEKEIPVLFSNETFNDIKRTLNKNEKISLQVFSIQHNIYWWSQSSIGSRLVSVSLNRQFKREHLLPIRYIDKPITILVDTDNSSTPTMIRGTTRMVDPNVDPLALDLGVRIHRFEPAVRSQVSVRFLFPPTKSSLRVFVMDQFRPDYTIMMKEAITITANSTVYKVPYYNYNEPFFIFMGILPGPEVAVNQSVEYAFEVNTALCKIWASAEWSSTGCHIKNVEGNQVHCECTHFSIFAAAFPVPPNQVDPYEDTKLFLTAIDNPYVVVFVLAILVIYLLLCLFLWRSDRNIDGKRSIVVLEDNMPSDSVPYLVVVYTSPRISAGTEAHVGIRLHGTEAQSRSHILSCKSHKILQRDNDDWFLIYCPEPLGDVEALHVWHDNTGSYAEWLCEKIVVYDLTKNTETLFVIDEWLALNKNEFPEAYVLSAAIEDVKKVKSLFLDNFVLGLREKHVLLSCMLSHPRSELTRLQRLSVFMCSFIVAMLCSIMFYLPTGQRVYVDNYTYSFSSRHLYVGMQTLIVSVCVTYIVLTLFKKSYKITYARNKTTLRLRSHSNKKSDIYSYDDQKQVNEGGSCYKSFVRVVSKTVKSNVLEPIKLPNSQPVVEVQRFWLILSWAVSIVIICLCSYLIMLYGLKLGVVHSKEWLTSLLIATGGDIMIFTPAKIIIMSSLLATALLSMYDLTLHRVDVNDLLLIRIPNDAEHVNNIVELRRHPMYKPLQQKEKDELLLRDKRRRKRWKCLDYLITVTTLITFNSLIYQMFLMNFYSTSHAVEMMTQTKQEVLETIKYDKILNISSLEKYLQYTFVNCLYDLRWYNGRLFDADEGNVQSGYWASDFIHRMLGTPAIRQLRMSSKRCGGLVIKSGICIPEWSYGSQDKDDYGKRWQPATWADVKTSNSPWRYSEPTSVLWLNRYRLAGPSGVTYVTGGYVEQLSSARKVTEVKLADLSEDSWLDGRTSAVFVEFSLYNVNEDVYVQVTLMVEYLTSGIALPRAQASAVKTSPFNSVLNLLFILMVIYFLIRCVLLLDREGVTLFFSYCANIFKMVIAVLGFLSIILFLVHYRVSSAYSQSFHRRGLDNYFDFDSLVHYYLLLRQVLSLLQCFVILHAFSLLMTRKSLVKHLNTVAASLKWIFWLTITCVTFLYTFILLNNIFQISAKYNVKNLTVRKKSLGFIELGQFQYLDVQMFVIANLVVASVFMWCYVVNFIVFVKVVKNHHSLH